MIFQLKKGGDYLKENHYKMQVRKWKREGIERKESPDNYEGLKGNNNIPGGCKRTGNI